MHYCIFWLRVERSPLSAKWIPCAEHASFMQGGSGGCRVRLPFVFTIYMKELCPDVLTFTDFLLWSQNQSKIKINCLNEWVNYFCTNKAPLLNLTNHLCRYWNILDKYTLNLDFYISLKFENELHVVEKPHFRPSVWNILYSQLHLDTVTVYLCDSNGTVKRVNAFLI